MTDPFLILHKCRGEPAFDIAIRQRCGICQGVGGHNVPDFETGIVSDYEGYSCDECNGDGFWWIIPTSGHRAHPSKAIQLTVLEEEGSIWAGIGAVSDFGAIPPGWPDHYPSRSATDPKINLQSVITALAGPTEPVERRF